MIEQKSIYRFVTIVIVSDKRCVECNYGYEYHE